LKKIKRKNKPEEIIMIKTKKAVSRMFYIFSAIILILAMQVVFSVPSEAAGTTSEGDLYINEVDYDLAVDHDYLEIDGWQWYAASSTLKLKDFTANPGSGIGFACQPTDNITVVYEGNNSIDENLGSSGNLNISGTGKLTIESVHYGIHVEGNLTIDGDIEINAGSDGIFSMGIITINNGYIEINASKDGISSMGGITINGGDIEINASEDGFFSLGDITINGGDIEINADFGGINLKGNITINSGCIEINADIGGIFSIGDITVNSGGVTVTGSYDGIFAEGDITVNSGGVTVTDSYKGISAEGNITIAGGKLGVVTNSYALVALGDISILGGSGDLKSDDGYQVVIAKFEETLHVGDDVRVWGGARPSKAVAAIPFKDEAGYGEWWFVDADTGEMLTAVWYETNHTEPDPGTEPPNTIEGFVTRMYKIILGRDPEEGGFEGWVDHLENGVHTGASAAHGFFFSDEYIARNRTSTEFIYDLYRTLMNRDPGPEEVQLYEGHLLYGYPREVIFQGFVMSDEFDELCNDAGIVRGEYAAPVIQHVTNFVTRLYRTALQREPDAGGLLNWVTNLQSGAHTGATTAYGFVFSEEMTARNLPDDEFVEILYGAFMGRASDPEGKAGWINHLTIHGSSREFVFSEFVKSDEFAGICNAYGINRGTYTPQG